MNDQPILTDTGLEAMLARRAGGGAPAGLAAEIAAALPGVPEARRPLRSIFAPPVARTPGVRLVWVVAIVGLLLAATVSAVFVGGELLRRSNELAVVPPPPVVPIPSAALLPSAAPSAAPVAVVTAPIERVNELAFARDGSRWLATAAGVVHWDVAGATATLYGQNEGLPTTEAIRIAVAPGGEVWAAGTTWLARYDRTWTVFTEFGSAGGATEVGGLAFAPDGALWAAIGTGSTGYLLRYDGQWSVTAIAGTEGGAIQSGCGSLGVAPDGTVWVNTCWSGVLAFDGVRWTRYDAAAAGLPDDPALAGVAPDGSAWVSMGAMCESETSCSDPGHGVASFDGERWTAYSAESGLADPDVHLEIGLDASIWATYGFAPEAVSRFDGTRWITVAVPGLAKAHALAAAPDGALWLSSADGLLRYDGATVTRHALPAIDVQPDLPPLVLTPESGPTTSGSALGDRGRHLGGDDAADRAVAGDGGWGRSHRPRPGSGSALVEWSPLGSRGDARCAHRLCRADRGRPARHRGDGRNTRCLFDRRPALPRGRAWTRSCDADGGLEGLRDARRLQSAGRRVVAGRGQHRPRPCHPGWLRCPHARESGELEQLATVRAGAVALGGRLHVGSRVGHISVRQGRGRAGRPDAG
jgi:hypothetical protein